MNCPIKDIEQAEKQRERDKLEKQMELKRNRVIRECQLKEIVFQIKAKIETDLLDKCKKEDPILLANWGFGGHDHTIDIGGDSYTKLLPVVNKKFVCDVDRVYGHIIKFEIDMKLYNIVDQDIICNYIEKYFNDDSKWNGRYLFVCSRHADNPSLFVIDRKKTTFLPLCVIL